MLLKGYISFVFFYSNLITFLLVFEGVLDKLSFQKLLSFHHLHKNEKSRKVSKGSSIRDVTTTSSLKIGGYGTDFLSFFLVHDLMRRH